MYINPKAKLLGEMITPDENVKFDATFGAITESNQ